MEEQMTGDILPPIKLGGLDDGSMSRTLKSSQGMRKDAQINKKLEQITEQLKAVRLKRSTLKKYDDGRVYGPKTDYSTVPKKFFSHPRLEYVYGEIMHSPYLTNPTEKYPKAVYTMSETIKELKHKGINFSEIPESERPFDQAQMKRSFIKEVCNYNPKFNVPKVKKSSTGSVTSSFQRASTANSSIIGRSTAGSSIASIDSMKEFSQTGPGKRPGSSNTGRGGRGGVAGSSGCRSGSSSGGSTNGNNSGNSTSGRVGSAGGNGEHKLNTLKPRKHASSTSMSLDASGYVPSSISSSNLLNSTDNTSVTNSNTNNTNNSMNKLTKAMSQAAEFVREQSLLPDTTESMRYTKEDVIDPEEEYYEDFSDPPDSSEHTTLPTTQHTTHTTLPTTTHTTQHFTDEYEQDFESVPQQLTPTAPINNTDSAYNEDFEPEIENSVSSESIPSEKVIYGVISSSGKDSGLVGVSSGVSSSSANNSGSGKSVVDVEPEETYQDDFAVKNEVVGSVSSTGVIGTDGGVSNVVSSDSVRVIDNDVSGVNSSSDPYTNDVAIPVVVPVVVNTIETVGATGRVDPESIKLRTDLINSNSNSNNNSSVSVKNGTDGTTNHTTTNSNATTINNTTTTNTNTIHTLQHESTTHSIQTEPSNHSIQTDDHTFSPPIPSTVRSEIDYTYTNTTTDTGSVGNKSESVENTSNNIDTTYNNDNFFNNTYNVDSTIGSTQQSYNNSFHSDIISENYSNNGNNGNTSDVEISESYSEYNTPKGMHDNVFSSNNGANGDGSGGVNGSSGIGGSSGIAVESEIIDEVETIPEYTINTTDNMYNGVNTYNTIHTTISTSPIYDATSPTSIDSISDTTHTILDTTQTINTTTHDTHTIHDTIHTVVDATLVTRDSPLEYPTSERLVDTTHSTTHTPTHEIDEIVYTEHKNTSIKENTTINNNYLNSPSKADLSNNNTIEQNTTNSIDVETELNQQSVPEVQVEVEVEPDFEVSSPVRDKTEIE